MGRSNADKERRNSDKMLMRKRQRPAQSHYEDPTTSSMVNSSAPPSSVMLSWGGRHSLRLKCLGLEGGGGGRSHGIRLASAVCVAQVV